MATKKSLEYYENIVAKLSKGEKITKEEKEALDELAEQAIKEVNAVLAQ